MGDVAEAEAKAPAGRFRDALRSRDLRLLSVSLLIDGLGSWAYTTVLIVYIYGRTGSTAWIAGLCAARWLPPLLVGSYGGVLADRYERTRVMIASALLSGSVMVAIAILVGTDGPLVAILAGTALGSTFMSPYRPATGALTPEVVPESDLTAANAIFAILENTVVVVGPAVGGIIAATGTAATGIWLNAGSFLVAAAIASRLRVRSRGEANEEGESAFKAFTDGLGALRSNRTSTALVLFCALDSSVYGASSVLFVRLAGQLGSKADGYAYLLAATAVGSVLAAPLANRLSTSSRLAPVILIALTVQTVPFLIAVWATSAAVGFVLMMFSGAGMVVVDVLCLTALQRDTPRAVLGRVLGLLDVAVLFATLAANFIFAWTLSAFSLHASLYVIGIGFPVAALIGVQPMVRSDREGAAQLRAIEPRIAVLERLDLFAKATRPLLEQMARAVEVVETPAGTDVVRQGEPSDALWIVAEGELQVTATGRVVDALAAPAYFGEIGLLHGVARTATVRTVTPCVLWRITSEDFLGAVETGTASVSMRQQAFSRLARARLAPVMRRDAAEAAG